MSDTHANTEGELAGEAAGVQPEPEAETLVFDVGLEDAGARLDAFLAARVEGVSRSTLKRVIDEGEVLVGGRAAKPSLKLKGGEHVEVELHAAAPPSEVTPEEIPLDIIHEDEEFVVVNKPAGLVVHPAAGVPSGTLANALAFHFEQLSGGGSLRPGIVHRLDRDTSGVIVVAKTVRAHEHLAEQFRERTVFKSYVALVHGVAREERGKIELPIGRDPSNRTRMSGRGMNGRYALSLWRVRQRFTRFTLLDVQIKTGRTHQIRVHLAWIKHPVVGDETYGGGRDKTLPDPALRARVNALGRQFLHAERLGFHHPSNGEWLSFTAPLPADLSKFLETLE
jgi:23S rRNA pseudouridine1911/1915/1917 synthase